MFNVTIPAEVIQHCEKHKLCKSCPLGTCVAPVGDHRYDEWLAQRIEVIKQVIN